MNVLAVLTSAILLAHCRYGLEAGSPLPPLTEFVVRADGHVTRTSTPMSDYTEARTESADIGRERFRQLAQRFDGSRFYGPAPKPTPDANGMTPAYTITSDTRDYHLAGRRGDLWSIWRYASHDVGEEHDDLLDAVYAVVTDPSLRWKAAPRTHECLQRLQTRRNRRSALMVLPA